MEDWSAADMSQRAVRTRAHAFATGRSDEGRRATRDERAAARAALEAWNRSHPGTERGRGAYRERHGIGGEEDD